MYYVGVDLHKNYLTVCVLDSAGEVMAEHARVRNTREAILEALGEWEKPVTVAMESCLHWAWLHDVLVAEGYVVEVAHPYQVKLISHARCKTDPVDARKLADLLRTNLLPTIWVPDPETRASRKLLRGRAFLVRTRTKLKNRVQAYLAEENHRVPMSDLFGTGGREWLEVVELPEASRLQVELLLETIDGLTERIGRLDGRIKKQVKVSPEAEQLMTVPGIGPFTALMISSEIGDIARFPTSHALTSYAGLVPSTRSSGGKTYHGTVGPAGNAWLKWAVVGAAQVAKRRPGPVRRHYDRLFRAKGKQKAMIGAARKLCCYLYWMMREGWSYEEWLEQHEAGRGVRPSNRLAGAA